MAQKEDIVKNEQLVAEWDPRSPAAEAYRTLRTNLQYTSLDRPLKTILVTSAVPGEGKTTIASNLAVAFAQSGKSVILVGADMRKPSVHQLFGLPNRVGLSTVLTGHVRFEDALQKSRVAGLHVLSSGPIPPNPAELLGSQRMQEVLEALREKADIVIFDAPPVIAVADAIVMSRYLDGVLFVVSLKSTPREAVQAAKDQLEQVGANILGAVVNRMDSTSGYFYYYYIRGYHETDEAVSQPSRWRGLFGRGATKRERGVRREAAAAKDE